MLTAPNKTLWYYFLTFSGFLWEPECNRTAQQTTRMLLSTILKPFETQSQLLLHITYDNVVKEAIHSGLLDI